MEWKDYDKCGTCAVGPGACCINLLRGYPLKRAHPGRPKVASEPAPVNHHIDVKRSRLSGFGDVWAASCSCGDLAGDWFNTSDAAETQGRLHASGALVSA